MGLCLYNKNPGTGKTKTSEHFIIESFSREDKSVESGEVIIFASDKNLLARASYNPVVAALGNKFIDYLVLLNQQESLVHDSNGFKISQHDSKKGGNLYFSSLEAQDYDGPIALFTTPSYILTSTPTYVFRSIIAYCVSQKRNLRIIFDEGDIALRSLASEITLSNVLQLKDCRNSKGYSTVNIKSEESFLPINADILPSSREISEGIITSFLKTSPVKTRSFEEYECTRPDDFCYINGGHFKFTDTPGNLHLEFSYYGTDCNNHEVFFRVKEIFLCISKRGKTNERISIVKFGETKHCTNQSFVELNRNIIDLVIYVGRTCSDQAATTLIFICRKIVSSNSLHIKGLFCKPGPSYNKEMVRIGKRTNEYLSYKQACAAYRMYSTTDNAELSDYVVRPKIGNVYKLSLVFNEAMKLRRLLDVKLAQSKEVNISLLSATFSELLVKLLDETLLIKNEPNPLVRSNWIRLFTAFETDDELCKKFDALKINENEALNEPISRWFMQKVY
jgi:hypothetical protein